MTQEVILLGFKVQVPLTPEDALQVEKIARGLRALRDRMKGTGAFFVPKEVPEALEAIHTMALCLLDASRAAAGPSSASRRK